MTRSYKAIHLLLNKEPYGIAFLLCGLSFLFFYAFRIAIPINVDTHLYVRSITTFEGPTIHFGYYLLGALFSFFLRPFGITSLQTLGFMSEFFGSICVGGIYVFTFLLTKNRLHSFLSACILMFSGSLWLFSIHGEVYVPQLAFALVSLILILKKKSMLSSFAILMAVSITPTSLLALPPLCYIIFMKKVGRKHTISFFSPILIIFVIAMLYAGPKVIETFANAIYPPTAFLKTFSYTEMLSQIIYRIIRSYGRSFNIMFLFAIFGLVALIRHNKGLGGLMLAFLLPFLFYLLNLGLFSDDHLIISFVAVSFLAAYGILGLMKILNLNKKGKVVLISLLLAIQCWGSFQFYIFRQRLYARELERVIHTLSSKYPHNAILLSDVNFGFIWTSVLYENLPFSLFNGNPAKYLKSTNSDLRDGKERLKRSFWLSLDYLRSFASRKDFRSIMDKRPIYFVEKIDWPAGLVQKIKDPLTAMGLERSVERPRKLENIREYLEYKLGTDIITKKIVDSPLHPVYLMKAKHCRAK